MDKPTPIVTLMTDFGSADGYVGTMKGVILGIVPQAQLVDISHHIAPQDVRQAAYVLLTAYPFFPPHTVHLAVVDPGVGSERRPIALRTPTGLFVGPDNGLFSYVVAREKEFEVVELANPRYRLPQVSHTFHGRDVFSPAAAHLAAGVPPADLGPAVDDPLLFPPPRMEISPQAIKGEVLHTDHFGNVITDVGLLHRRGDELWLTPAFQADAPVRLKPDRVMVVAGGREIGPIRRTYSEVERGEVLALVGSEGYLELAVREGSGAALLGLKPGDPVHLILEV